MEKRTAHYPLDRIRQLIKAECYRFTRSARQSVRDQLGFIEEDALLVIERLQPIDLHKSMTSYQDHTLWQDVYKPVCQGKILYIKLQILDDNTVVVSFKKAEE